MKKLALIMMVVIVSVAVMGLLGTNAVTAQDETFPELIDLPNGFFPEGIAVGRGTDFFVGSLLTGAVYGGDLRTGEGDIVVPPQEGRTAVGLAVDKRSNAIFVAGGGPFLNPVLTGSAYVYDAETGDELAVYEFATGEDTFVNDVIVTRDAAYFTDSFRPVLYKVPLGPGGELPNPATFAVLPLGANFEFVPGEVNANGIEATPNGKVLLLVNLFTGKLYQVDLDTGEATQIDGVSVPTGDGLLLDGKTLYVVQNGTVPEQVAVVKLNSKLTAGTVVDVITNNNFDVPTTVAGFGNGLYVVNARFNTPPEPDTEYKVVRVPKR